MIRKKIENLFFFRALRPFLSHFFFDSMIARSKSAQTARRYEIVTRETFSHPPSDMKDATTRTNWIDERHLAQTGLESFYFFASKTYFLRQQLRTRERDNDTRCYHCYPFTLFLKIFICGTKVLRFLSGII